MAWVISACLLVTSIILQSSVTIGQQYCGNDPLCFDKPDEYPQKMIDDFLAKHKSLPYKPDYDDEEIQRLNYEEDDETNCSTEVYMRKPYTLTHKNRSYPVIQSKYFSQRIRDVSCKRPGRSCFKKISLLDPFRATCETQKGNIQLYVFDEDKNKVVALPAPFNCCCKCTIRSTMN